MKKICYLFFTLTTFAFVFPQNPLNVIITGDCDDLSASYNYTGVVNGKNHYTYSFFDEEEDITVEVSIGFDGNKWVLYSFDFSNYGFFNTQVQTSLLPPFSGWQLNECEFGVMSISEILSSNTFKLKELIVSPNPIKNFISINQEVDFFYEIFNAYGKTIKKGKTIDSIVNFSNFENGFYILHLYNNEESYFIKVLKN